MTAFIDVARPNTKSLGYAYDVLCVLTGSLFLALMAQLSFPLWFTPVPITLQALAVMLISASLGSKRGALAVLAYLAEGAMGFPVFAGGLSGVSILFGTTGGYLFSFVISAFVMGFLLEKGWKNSYVLTIAALSVGSVLMLVLGALYLGIFVGIQNAFALGILPFLTGSAVKILIAAAIIPSGWKVLHHFR